MQRMRKSIFVLILLTTLSGAALFTIFRLTRARRPPTSLGWRAQVTTIAGDGSPRFADGQSRQASFADPFGIAIGSDGSIYVSDARENNTIRKFAHRCT